MDTNEMVSHNVDCIQFCIHFPTQMIHDFHFHPIGSIIIRIWNDRWPDRRDAHKIRYFEGRLLIRASYCQSFHYLKEQTMCKCFEICLKINQTHQERSLAPVHSIRSLHRKLVIRCVLNDPNDFYIEMRISSPKYYQPCKLLAICDFSHDDVDISAQSHDISNGTRE